MNETRNLTRRDFIKVTSAAGAGLVIGFALPAVRELEAMGAEPAEPFTPNAWLSIDTKGIVTITVSKSEMGQGVRTSLPMIMAEELEADWASIRVQPALADKKYGSMGTGGSSSVRSNWDPLRKAGATAREMLIAAAAAQWNVQPETCKAESGTVTHKPSGKTSGYGELAARAATMKPPASVQLKEPHDFRIIGKPVHRVDSPEKVNGKGLFGIDVSVPGMLVGVVARCPVFGGKVASFDATKAKTIAGVKQVAEIESGVLVLAETTWDAMRGRDALVIHWNEGPHADLSSAKIAQMLKEASAKPGAIARKEGDPLAAIEGAKKRLDALYEVPFLAHATMEPMNCVADVRKDRCEIWAPTQSPQGAQNEAAHITGLPQESITVHTTLLGGGFGRRASTDFIEDAVRASQVAGAPVKVVWSREDDMHHDFYRPISNHHMRAGFDAGGKLVAWMHHLVAPSISEQRQPGAVKEGLDHSALSGAEQVPYAAPNIQVDYVMANTPVPIGAWRSVYASQNAFANECFVDELAALAKKDPVEFRRELLGGSPRLKGVLELAAEKGGWGKPLPAGHYRGVACHASFGSFVAHVVDVSVSNRIVRVHSVVSAIDCGIVINPDTVRAQMESAIVFGLTAALKGEITIDKGRTVQDNFDDYQLMTIEETPSIEIHIVESTEGPGGIGEPGVPPIAPAVANAVSAATGKRIRKLPISV